MLEVKNIAKKFGSLQALQGINFTMQAQETLGIIGPSGSGKSTLLRILMGLETQDEGQIIIWGQEITALESNQQKRLREEIGYIFQDFSLFDHMSVKQNIQLAPKLRKTWSAAELEQRTQQLAKLLQMEEKLSSYPSTLSGGQKQRAAIARCLILQPKLILFDEPTSALDRATTDELIKIIELLKQQQIPMIIVTHDLGFAQNVATRLLFMKNSAIILDKKVEEIAHLDQFFMEQFTQKE